MTTEHSTTRPRGAISWMAGNSVAANLMMLLFVVGGFMFSLRIKQEIFPEMDIDKVVVSVPYPGASPEEVETAIVMVIEESIRGLDGVDEVSSTAAEGMGMVVADLLTGADVNVVAQDVKSEIDRITTFPADAEEPQVTIPTLKREVISLLLYGNHSESVMRAAAETVRDRLLEDPGITQVELSGIRPHEISVEIPQAKLREYQLTLDQVAARLRGASVELPGGGIKTDGGEVLLRMKERRDLGREFERIPLISLADGTRLSVGDVGRVVDGFEDVDRFLSYNAQPAIMITVYRVGKQTPITVAETVRKLVDELSETTRGSGGFGSTGK